MARKMIIKKEPVKKIITEKQEKGVIKEKINEKQIISGKGIEVYPEQEVYGRIEK